METFDIRNLTFCYNGSEKTVLNNISLKISKGEFVLICGRSGCGKTTLLSHLKPAMSPAGRRNGTLLYKGIPLYDLDEVRQASEIGYVMQNPHRQIVTDKVWHEISFGLECLGTDVNEMHRRVADISYFFGIDKWFDRDIRTLSGGQKQLVNLASVMAMHPDVLILDEPTSQLDPVRAQEFLSAVHRINSELGTTVIITEHRTESLFSYADRLIYMDNGEIIADGSIRDCIEIAGKDIIPYLPVPTQVFLSESSESGDIPLTINEGRIWLENYRMSNNFSVCELHSSESKKPDSYRIEIKNAYFRYEKSGRDILHNCCVRIPKGSIYAILGGNGSGKSTLLKNICGISRPYSGKIDVTGFAAYVPQESVILFSSDTVYEELTAVSDSKEKIAEISEICHITDLYDMHPYDISAGQQQRVALAKIILSGAEILLLDEITKGMDILFKNELGQILKSLAGQGKTIVIVSHDVEFCSRYADRIGMFFDGTITGEDIPVKFFSENNFYTTSASRLSRGILKGTVSAEDIIRLCRINTISKE